MEKIFELITEYGLNERMDTIISSDMHYQELMKKIEEAMKPVDTSNQHIDTLLSLQIKADAYYSTLCYKQGYLDCIQLLKDLNIL